MTNTTKPTTIADIGALVDRYMSGETTNEEETALRSWFRQSGENVPMEWASLKAMFAFVDSERDSLSTQRKAATPLHPAGKGRPAKRHGHRTSHLVTLHRPSLWISSVVASAAVAVAVVFLRMSGTEPQSYAVIDGKMYTDPEVVRKQAVDALNVVSADVEDPFSALDMMQ